MARNSPDSNLKPMRDPEDDILAKGLGRAIGLGLALAAGGASGSEQPKQDTPSLSTPSRWTSEGLLQEMYPIAFLESSWGKNMAHAKNPAGEYETALGALGFKPSTAHEIWNRSKTLQSKYPGLETPDSFINKMSNDHHFYNTIAGVHWNQLKRQLGTPEKAAYGWRWGATAAANASDEQVSNEPYVQRYKQLSGRIVPEVPKVEAEKPLSPPPLVEAPESDAPLKDPPKPSLTPIEKSERDTLALSSSANPADWRIALKHHSLNSGDLDRIVANIKKSPAPQNAQTAREVIQNGQVSPQHLSALMDHPEFGISLIQLKNSPAFNSDIVDKIVSAPEKFMGDENGTLDLVQSAHFRPHHLSMLLYGAEQNPRHLPNFDMFFLRPDLEPESLHQWLSWGMDHPDIGGAKQLVENAAHHPSLSDQTFQMLMTSNHPAKACLIHRQMTGSQLGAFIHHNTWSNLGLGHQMDIARAIGNQDAISLENIEEAARSRHPQVRAAIASHPSTPVAILKRLSEDPSGEVRWALLLNPHTPEDIKNSPRWMEESKRNTPQSVIPTKKITVKTPDVLPEEIKKEPGLDSEFVDEDPWTQLKYRRGGEKEFAEWLQKRKNPLNKADQDFGNFNQDIDPTLLYRSYKNSPHHPMSLLLKYSINRLENKDFYDKATPEQIAERDSVWIKHHQQGGAADKNGHIKANELKAAFESNPKIEAGLKAHQQKMHDYLKQHSSNNIKYINGEPHVALARGFSIDAPGADHEIASYTDNPKLADDFGGKTKNWNVPLKNIWYSYDVGPEEAAGSNFGPEDEFLVSNHPRLEADRQDVRQLVPRNHFEYQEPDDTWKLANTPNPDPKVIQKALQSNDPDQWKAVASNKDATERQLTLAMEKDDEGTQKAVLQNPNVQASHISYALEHGYPKTKKQAAEHKLANKEHLEQAVLSGRPAVIAAAFRNPNMTSEMLNEYGSAGSLDGEELRAIAHHPNVKPETLDAMVSRNSPALHSQIFQSPNATPEQLDKWFESSAQVGRGSNPHYNIAHNKNTSPETLHKIYKKYVLNPHQDSLASTAIENPNISQETLAEALATGHPGAGASAAMSPKLSHEQITQALQHHDEDIRTGAARNPNATEEHLHTAIKDPSIRVAQAALEHHNITPAHIQEALTHPDPGIRYRAAAHKLTKTPSLSSPSSGESYENLKTKQNGWRKTDRGLRKSELLLKMAIKHDDLQNLKTAIDSKKGSAFVDASKIENPHPHLAEQFKKEVVNSPEHSESLTEGLGGITTKLAYRHGDNLSIVKPFHEKMTTGLSSGNPWSPHPIRGWAEMASQALYHAGGIGNLHQKVSVVPVKSESGDMEHGLVVHAEKDVKPIKDMEDTDEDAPAHLQDQARKIAVMDFLTNNPDRHNKNLMYRHDEHGKPISLLGIDHGQSFGYTRVPDERYHNESDRPVSNTDNFANYTKKAHGEMRDDLGFGTIHRDDPAWHDTAHWWGQNKENIKKAFDKSLEAIVDPEAKAHLKANFEERHQGLGHMFGNLDGRWDTTMHVPFNSKNIRLAERVKPTGSHGKYQLHYKQEDGQHLVEAFLPSERGGVKVGEGRFYEGVGANKDGHIVPNGSIMQVNNSASGGHQGLGLEQAMRRHAVEMSGLKDESAGTT